ncbi:MAG: chromate transporter [Cytophagales bacterium]|nr:chromate transporter [Cytophagales bacterium]
MIRRLMVQLTVFAVLWLLPLGLFYRFAPEFGFWQQLTVFFTQAALVTFGGAYAVLPYVAQVSVEKLHWLSNLEMMDGLALGETTPGPLIIVLAFVGFMAGYHQFGGSTAMAGLGLVTTTYYTFLPCFLFIFAGAPIIERTQDNPKLKQLLGLVTAAVVGVILNLAIYLAKAIVFPKSQWSQPEYWMLAWIVVSLVALYRFKVNMIVWIGVNALYGLALHLVKSI